MYLDSAYIARFYLNEADSTGGAGADEGFRPTFGCGCGGTGDFKADHPHEALGLARRGEKGSYSEHHAAVFQPVLMTTVAGDSFDTVHQQPGWARIGRTDQGIGRPRFKRLHDFVGQASDLATDLGRE